MPKYTVLSNKHMYIVFALGQCASVNVLYMCYTLKGNAIASNVMGVCRGKVLMCYTVICQKSKGGHCAV